MIVLFFLFLFSLNSGIFEEAAKEYVRGNFSYSYKLLKEYLSANPEDKKAIEMYVRVCVKLTEESLNKGKDRDAYFYASQAYKYKPKDPKVENLYLVTRKLLEEKVPEEKLEMEKIKVPQKKLGEIKLEAPKVSEKPKVKIEKKEKRKIRGERKPEERIKVVTKIKKIKEIERYIPEWVYLSIFFNLLLISGVFIYFRMKNPPKPDERFYSNVITSKLLLANLLKKKSDFLKRKIPSSRLKDLLDLLEVPEKMPPIKIKWRDKDKYLPDFDPVPRLISDRLEVLEKFVENQNEILPILRQYLKHPHNRVRATACKVMAKFRPQEAFKVLKEMSDSEDRWMKISAIWALSEIGGNEAVKLLTKLKNDPDFMVSERAEEALKKLELRA